MGRPKRQGPDRTKIGAWVARDLHAQLMHRSFDEKVPAQEIIARALRRELGKDTRAKALATAS